jgi:predicted  nucleic acid-binding Zn-ribbon protein
MADIEKELDALGEEIEEKKREIAQKEGSISTLHKQLKDEFGLGSTKEADAEMVKLSKEIDKIEKEVEKDFEKLKEVYSI